MDQAVNQTLNLGANLICTAKFVSIGYQWNALYGTAVDDHSTGAENDNEVTNTTDATTPECIPDFPDYSGDEENVADVSVIFVEATPADNISEAPEYIAFDKDNENEAMNSTEANSTVRVSNFSN